MKKEGISAEQIVQNIKNKKLAPVYFLDGEEPYFIDLVMDSLEKDVLQEAEKSFNLIILYGKDVDVSTILNNARRFPMMAERQVVLVKEAQSVRDITNESGIQKLEGYLDNPVPSTVLAFGYKNKKIDKRTSLGKKLSSKSVYLTSAKLWENQVPAWINDYVAARGKRVSFKANTLLTEYIGNNLERMSNEINKMLLNIPENEVTIEDTHVEKYVGINKDYNIFELQDALLQRNLNKVYQILDYLIKNEKSNSPIMMIAVLYSFFTKLLTLAYATQTRNQAAISALGLRGPQASKFNEGIRFFTVERTRLCIHYLSEADARLKGIDSGSLKGGQILREFVYKILH